ncbi:MAG TPA: glycohydrolase toxin TNT-related protein, partial [Pseudonocardiaceae bacterium]|nr:glycohydrolase toxin TNT-related protein [Pseudonocardiaceae bacterium]
TPVITPIGIAPNKSTQYDPQDAPATAGAGGGGGGGNGPGTGTLTGNPGPFGGIPLLGLLNLISGLINLQNCKGALSCTAAALAFLPGGGALDGLTTSEGLDGLAGDESGLASDCAIGATHSFAGSTQVLMADDTSEPIKDVKVGDVIKNAEPDGKTETHKVDDVHTTRTDTDFTDLTVSTGKSSSMVTSTQNHPYWDVTQDQFVTAANLHVGDRLQTDSNTTVTVATVRNYTASQVTYDLTIDDLHTYYVEAGNTPVLVHNAGGCGPLDNGYKWPRNNGFEGPSVTVNIPDGYQFDRYGGIPDKDPGRFASPAGTPFEMRGLPSSSLSRLFTTYEVVRPFDVQTGMVRPWGGQPGGGFQLNFSSSIAELLKEGYIRVVP